MTRDENPSAPQPKRVIKTFEPDSDVLKMLRRAGLDGLKTKFILNSASREWLTKKGYAKKRELQAA